MAKKLRENKFHSYTLLPEDVVLGGAEAITDFEKRIRKGYIFDRGATVVHKENLESRMIVQDIIKKVSERDNKLHLDGIVCHWWEE